MISQARNSLVQPVTETVGLDARDIARAERFGQAVAQQLANRNFEAARAAINHAEREYLRSLEPKVKSSRPLDAPISEIGLDVRTANYLEEIGIFTVGDLLERTPEELRAIPGMGAVYIRDCIKAASDWIGRPAPPLVDPIGVPA